MQVEFRDNSFFDGWETSEIKRWLCANSNDTNLLKQRLPDYMHGGHFAIFTLMIDLGI
jgi:hypothetical protein